MRTRGMLPASSLKVVLKAQMSWALEHQRWRQKQNLRRTFEQGKKMSDSSGTRGLGKREESPLGVSAANVH